MRREAGWRLASPSTRRPPTRCSLRPACSPAPASPARCSSPSGRAAYPAAGFGDRDHLPTLRSDAADRLVGRDRPVTWPFAFLHLVAESAARGARPADHGRGAGQGARHRGRQTLAAARRDRGAGAHTRADAEGARGKTRIAPQTGTALLRELQAKRVAREVTGRGSFRAFAI